MRRRYCGLHLARTALSSSIHGLPKLKSVLVILVILLFPVSCVVTMQFSDPHVLSSSDPPHHILFCKTIEKSGSVLVPHSQFPKGEERNAPYYPSFFHIEMLVLSHLTGLDLMFTMRVLSSLFFISFGILFYFFIREYWPGRLWLRYFLLLLLMSNSSLTISLIKMGSLGESMAMCVFLPSLLILIVRGKAIGAALLVTAIAGAHSISTIMVGLILLSLLLSFILTKDILKLKTLAKMCMSGAFFAIPLFVIYKKLVLLVVKGSGVSGTSPLPLSFYPSFLGEPLWYLGVAGAIILLFYSKERFVSLWALLYILYTQYAYCTFPPSRIVRELPVALSLATGLLIFKLVSFRRVLLNNYLRVMIVAITVNAFIFCGVGQIHYHSTPPILYGSPIKYRAYSWLKTHLKQDDCILLFQFADPYLVAFLDNECYPIVSPTIQKGLFAPDREINNELIEALNCTHPSNLGILEKYGITKIVVSSPPYVLDSRGLYPSSERNFINNIATKLKKNGTFSLVYHAEAQNKFIRVYDVPHH